MKKGMKHLNAQEYDKIKAYYADGFKSQDIARVTGRSHTTLSYIKNSENFQAYIAYVRKLNNKYKPKPLSKPGVPGVATSPLGERTLAPKDLPDAALYSRLGNVESLLETLVAILQEREAKANVAFWKR